MDKIKDRLSAKLHKARDGPNQAGPQSEAEDPSKPAHQQPLQTPREDPQSEKIPPEGQVISTHQPIIPKLKSQPKILGLVGDPSLNRDSGGSVRFGDRMLWTYRDTQLCNPDGSVKMFPIISSTASWSDLVSSNGHTRPEIQVCSDSGGRSDPLKTNVLLQYGKNSEHQSFFPVPGPHICDAPAGNRSDGTRIALWPDQPPLVTSAPGSDHVVAYTWVKKSHIGHDLSVKTENPGTILYKTEYKPSKWPGGKHDLPKTSIVNENFWQQGEIAYGAYGNLVFEGYAYLYGQIDHKTALARVPISSIETRSAYEFWQDSTWTTQLPSLSSSSIEIINANASGQGTYYFSPHWRRIVWIGGDIFPGAECYICTAPRPEGPWTKPEIFWTGPRGNHALGAYSIQAHPGICGWFENAGDREGEEKGRRNEIYITYTKNDEAEKGDVAVYTTPLVYVEFE